MQQLPALGRFVVEVPVRHAGAAQVIAEPVGAGRVGRPDDAEGDLGRFTGLVPGREEFGHRRVQVSLRREPRDVQVIVDLPHRHRRDGGMRAGPVAPVDEQDPLGPGVQASDAGQEIDRGHVRQALVRDDQRDLGARARQDGQHGQRRRGRAPDADLVVGLVAPARSWRSASRRGPSPDTSTKIGRCMTASPWGQPGSPQPGSPPRLTATGSRPAHGNLAHRSGQREADRVQLRWRSRGECGRRQVGPRIRRITGRSCLRRATTSKPCRANVDAMPV